MTFHSTYTNNKRSDDSNGKALVKNKLDSLKSLKENSASRLIKTIFLVMSLTPVLSVSDTGSRVTLLPGDNFSAELFIENNSPVNLEIDTKGLSKTTYGRIPIRFYSENESTLFYESGKIRKEIFWHNKDSQIMDQGELTKANNDQYIHLKLNTTDEMVGKKVKVILEKEENLSKAAAVGAFLPQAAIPATMAILGQSVQWQPHYFWPSILRWNYLLLELDIIRSVRKLIQRQMFADTSSLFAQCSADFFEGLAAYSLTNYDEELTEKRDDPQPVNENEIASFEMRRIKTFRTYLRTTPTNRMLDCISAKVSDSLKALHHEGKLPEVVGNWPMLETLNDETLEGIAKLMVGYGFNFFANVPGGLLSSIRDDMGLLRIGGDSVSRDFTGALKTSIQYTIHKGYLSFFRGRGWNDTSAHALSAGVGIFEIGYRFYRLKGMLKNDPKLTADPEKTESFEEVKHQLTSIGERAEAIASSGYQLIPLPTEIKQYAVPVAAATTLTWLSYYAVNSTGILNTATSVNTQLFLRVVQKGLTSATNGLVLGALAYVILPYVKDIAARATQMGADQLVSWTDAEKDSWVGYFAARDTQYRIRVVIIN